MADDEQHQDNESDVNHTPADDESRGDMDQSTEPAALWEQLEAARAERDQYRDQSLRAQAELENYRKRVNRQREEDLRFGTLPLTRDLLPVIDHLDLAVHAAGQTDNAADLIKGVEMVLSQFADVLAAHSVRAIPALGEPFDANRHEAIAQIPTPDHPPMTVVQEEQRGYTLHDRVLRPSKVIVAAAPPAE